jgi:hypothetical protein
MTKRRAINYEQLVKDAEHPVIFRNAFRMYDTMGLPLSVQIDRCREYGIPLSLPDFVLDAVRAGWPFEKAILVAGEAVVEVDGSSWNDYMVRYMEPYCRKLIAEGTLLKAKED